MPDQDSGQPKPVAPVFLAFVAIALLSVASVGYLGDEEEAVTLGLLLFGSILAVIAAVVTRIEGTLKIGKDGAEIPIEAANRAERQLNRGEWVRAEQLEEAVEAVEQAPQQIKKEDASRQIEAEKSTSAAASEKPSGPDTTTVERLHRQLIIVDDVVVNLATLTENERQLVTHQFEIMSEPDFDPSSDKRAHRAGQGGHAYYVRRVPGTLIRIWYRELGLETGEPKLVVLVVEKKDVRV
ncbi:hypothetical protein [Rhodococcus aetherivorans]